MSERGTDYEMLYKVLMKGLFKKDFNFLLTQYHMMSIF